MTDCQLCVAALSASGLAVSAPAVAAPGPPASPVAAAAVPDELLVGDEPGATPASQERARGRARAVRIERVVPARADRAEVELVRLPAGTSRATAIRELESDPAVAYAEPNWIYTRQATSTDSSFTDGRLWGMYGDRSSPANQYGSQAAEAWACDHTGSGTVYVGVIDEGIQTTHPDLAETVDLGAPRVGEWSTTAFSTYSSHNDTSTATPHVSGAAALYAASHLTAKAADIKAAIWAAPCPPPP